MTWFRGKTFLQKPITHVAFVIDASGSMGQHAQAVVDVFDNQIKFLARRSEELDQEARVAIYVFDDVVHCLYSSLDVLRMPSLKGLYQVGNTTALLAATLLAQEDLAQTFTKYGDHAFLTFVITDGFENASPRGTQEKLVKLLAEQAAEGRWTIAALVPGQNSRIAMQDLGFPAGNIEVWDIHSATGVEEAGKRIQASTDAYMTSRTQTGLRSTNTLFAGSAQQVNAQTVQAAGLTPLDPDKFFLTTAASTDKVPLILSGVRKRTRKDGSVHTSEGIKCVDISALIEATGRRYVVGNAFYELVKKKETVAGNKRIAVVERDTHKVYMGKAARQLIGLGDQNAVVMPVPPDASGKPPFKVFIESQSFNRHVPIGSQVLYLK